MEIFTLLGSVRMWPTGLDRTGSRCCLQIRHVEVASVRERTPAPDLNLVQDQFQANSPKTQVSSTDALICLPLVQAVSLLLVLFPLHIPVSLQNLCLGYSFICPPLPGLIMNYRGLSEQCLVDLNWHVENTQ